MRLGNCGQTPGQRAGFERVRAIGDVERNSFRRSRKRGLISNLTPRSKMRPIRTVRPDSVRRLGLLDEVGSPVCDVGEWFESTACTILKVDKFVGHMRGPEARYRSIIKVQNMKGNRAFTLGGKLPDRDRLGLRMAGFGD